jgi:predicted transcriptional regulator
MSTPAVHHEPRDTEVMAAAVVRPHLNRLQRQVLARLVESKPYTLTCEDIVEEMGWEPYKRTTVGPRLTELANRGLIEDSGIRRKGPNQGSPSIAWRAL